VKRADKIARERGYCPLFSTGFETDKEEEWRAEALVIIAAAVFVALQQSEEAGD